MRAQMSLRETVPLAISTDAAYDLVADFARLAEWDPAVADSERISGERLTPGSRYLVTARFLGRRPVLEYELIETTGPARTIYRATGSRFESVDRVEIAPASSGCLVTFAAEVTTSGWVAAFRWPIGLVMRRQGAASLAALRAHAATLTDRE